MRNLKQMLIRTLVIVLLTMNGCGAVSKQPDETDSGKRGDKTAEADKEMVELEVTFLNYCPGMGLDTAVMRHNNYFSAYIPGDNPETLYAFLVEIDNYYDGVSNFPEDYPDPNNEDYMQKRSQYLTAKAVELMEKTGLTILPDYPYCSYNRKESSESDTTDNLTLGLCAVVGTLEDVKKIFDETESMEGWFCYVWSAPRPDMLEKIRESGWNGTVEELSPYDGPSDFYKSILGEENQVKMRIEVKK